MSNDYFIDSTLDLCEKYTGRKDITFVIQGKMTDKDILLRNIRNLCKWGKVVLCVWGVTPTLDEQKILEYIRLNRINNEQNVYLQVYTTLSGLTSVDTPFAIKVRADEYYSNFGPFIEEMESHLDKIVTTNVFFRKTRSHKYHISDHIIGGLTDNVTKMFTNCKRLLGSKRTPQNVTSFIPEQWLTVGYLLSYYTEDSLKSDPKEKMISHFRIVPLEKFEDFIVVYTQHIRGKKIKTQVRGLKEMSSHKLVDVTSIDQI